jgi:hypothetical protein
MFGLYTIVYTTIFSVMLCVMVTRTQNFGGFEAARWAYLPKIISAVLIVVLGPILFFVFALPVVNTFPTAIERSHLIIVLFWTTPAYGFQQAWLIPARRFHWVTDNAVIKSKPAYKFWAGVFVIFVLLPVLHLVWFYSCR